MERTVGLVDMDSGERGWLRFDPDKTPVTVLLWFRSKAIENRVREYLNQPQFLYLGTGVKGARGELDGNLVRKVERPVTNGECFQAALDDMGGTIQVRMD